MAARGAGTVPATLALSDRDGAARRYRVARAARADLHPRPRELAVLRHRLRRRAADPARHDDRAPRQLDAPLVALAGPAVRAGGDGGRDGDEPAAHRSAARARGSGARRVPRLAEHGPARLPAERDLDLSVGRTAGRGDRLRPT